MRHLSLLLLFSCGSAYAAALPKKIEFNRDVRGILTDKCLACHGPDAKTVEGDLRLDLRDDAIRPREDGPTPIVPGNAEASEVVKRMFSTDEDDIMPPPKAHKPLTPHERELLKAWIEQGAEYEPHWAYTPLDRPTPPKTRSDWIRQPIDAFIAARHAEENVRPNPEADRVTLVRRLFFDLTGLPPTPAEVDAFVQDGRSDAYERLVNRLLASPRYGERMAIYWLDLVRYADTVGYHGDQNVSQSPYRDYVIKAFNDNLSYDRFVREQLAGDLLPDATIDQLVASGYNRLNQTTEEGGAQAKEYLAIYFADRVRNVSQVFMGATVGCAQCHDHKYDPYTTKDFYSLGAFFADLQEVGKYGARKRPPEIRVPSLEAREQMAAMDQQIAALKATVPAIRKQVLSGQAGWEADARTRMNETKEVETAWIDDQQDTGGKSEGAWTFVTTDKGPVHSGSKSRRQAHAGLVQHFFSGATRKTVTASADTRFYAWIHLDAKNPPKAVMLQLNDGTTWDHRAVWGSDDIGYGKQPENWAGYQRRGALPETGKWVRLEVDASTVGLKPGTVVKGMAFTQFGGLAHWDKAGWITQKGIPAAVATALALAPDQRNPAQRKAVEAHFISQAEPVQALNTQIAQLEAERKKLEESGPMTVVSKSVKPRTIRILPRGNWMDDSGDIVQPAIPEFLGKLDTGDERATRLDFATWLGEPDNVLSSRTMVNRLWYLMFGRGICSSVDDFGGQGTFPSHPELLDWLAVEFVESGWDIKHMLRLMVTSATYRQSSRPSPELRANDPYNEWFARQARFPLVAESVRDNALAISGLLVEKIGGVSARPYQPAKYYAQLNFPRRTYKADTDENQYRRGVYTHWQRTFLHPMLKAFDAPSREECTAARSRSNTPLQALSLLNDPTFVEAARVFAARIMREAPEDIAARVDWAYHSALSRAPDEAIASELRTIYEQHLAHYQENEEAARQLVTEGNAPPAENLPPTELAAWTSVARVILNLHETITRY